MRVVSGSFPCQRPCVPNIRRPWRRSGQSVRPAVSRRCPAPTHITATGRGRRGPAAAFATGAGGVSGSGAAPVLQRRRRELRRLPAAPHVRHARPAADRADRRTDRTGGCCTVAGRTGLARRSARRRLAEERKCSQVVTRPRSGQTRTAQSQVMGVTRATASRHGGHGRHRDRVKRARFHCAQTGVDACEATALGRVNNEATVGDFLQISVVRRR